MGGWVVVRMSDCEQIEWRAERLGELGDCSPAGIKASAVTASVKALLGVSSCCIAPALPGDPARLRGPARQLGRAAGEKHDREAAVSRSRTWWRCWPPARKPGRNANAIQRRVHEGIGGQRQAAERLNGRRSALRRAALVPLSDPGALVLK